MSNIKAFLFDDDRGVSPVIEVILMVAITVILAAVIAAFVLGLGDTNSTAPSVTFDYDYTEGDGSNSTVEVEVTSGESFDASLVEYQVEGAASSSSSFSGSTLNGAELSTSEWSDGTSAGDTIVIELGGVVETQLTLTTLNWISSSRQRTVAHPVASAARPAPTHNNP